MIAKRLGTDVETHVEITQCTKDVSGRWIILIFEIPKELSTHLEITLKRLEAYRPPT